MPLPSGRALLDPDAILQVARLSPGQRYADFGAGTLGHFVFPAARIVGPGTSVYAVDILKSALDAINSRARVEQVPNVKTVWGDIEKIGGVNIEPNSLDLISLVNIASLIKKSPNVLEEAKRLLNDNGKLLVVGWRKDARLPVAPSAEKRVSLEEIKEQIKKAGMVIMKEFEAGPDHWGLLVRKKPFKDYPIKIIG